MRTALVLDTQHRINIKLNAKMKAEKKWHFCWLTVTQCCSVTQTSTVSVCLKKNKDLSMCIKSFIYQLPLKEIDPICCIFRWICKEIKSSWRENQSKWKKKRVNYRQWTSFSKACEVNPFPLNSRAPIISKHWVLRVENSRPFWSVRFSLVHVVTTFKLTHFV